MQRIMKISSAIAIAALPLVTLAQDGVFRLITMVQAIIVQLVPIIIGIAVLTFLWGVLQYVVAKDEEKQKEARSVMLYGIIALFVMVAVWGLVNILVDSLELKTTVPNPPKIPGING